MEEVCAGHKPATSRACFANEDCVADRTVSEEYSGRAIGNFAGPIQIEIFVHA